MAALITQRPADGVALVVLNRPDRMNALDDELLLDALPGAFVALDQDETVRCVVLTGAGRAFSAGADFECSGFGLPTPVESEEFTRQTHQTPVDIRRMSTPTIAAVNGAAVGAGFGLALACDIRLAGPQARFGAPFVAMGLVPDFGVSYFLPRVLGTSAALEILLTGQLLDADEARRIGIVSRVEDDVVAAAIDLATSIAAMPRRAVAMTRANVYRSLEISLDAEVLEQESRAQGIALHGSEFAALFDAYKQRIRGAK